MASNGKKLVLGAIALDRVAGGLEKNIINLANAMSARGFDVHLVTFDGAGAESFYPLDKKVTWHKTGLTAAHGKISFSERLKLITRIREILKTVAPAPIVCFHHGILLRFFLASLFLNCKLMCSERNALSLYKEAKKFRWNPNFLLLHACDKITVQFPGYVHDYPSSLRSRIVPIANPVFPARGQAKPDKPDEKGRYHLLSVVRLCAQKNTQALLNAFALLQQDFPDWDLHIAGDGPQEEELKTLSKKLNLKNRVIFHGKTENVAALYESAHLFCLPSKWEGFPNAMAEAMSYGLPAAGYAGCRGVADLVEGGKTGFLAAGNGDVQTLTEILRKLMENPDLRQKTGESARKQIQNYAPETIYKHWEEIL